MDEKSLQLLVQLIKACLPDFDDMLSSIESKGGFWGFKEEGIRILAFNDNPTWSKYYEHWHSLKLLLFELFFSAEEVAILAGELKSSSKSGRQAI